MKKLLLIIVFLIFLDISFAVELGISPPKLEFKGNINEKICKDIAIYTKGYSGVIIGEDKWKQGDFSKDITKYSLDSKSLGLNVDYLKNFNIKKTGSKKNINVCITAEKSGVYYGALIFRGENSYAGVANWISVDIANNIIEKQEESSLKTVTGSLIKSYSKPSQGMITGLLLVFVILIISVWLIKNKFSFEI